MDISRVLSISNEKDFNNIALEIFQHQAINNTVYQEYIKALGLDRSTINHYKDIPFLPIQFFKSHDIISNPGTPTTTFTSSGTTGMINSKHHVFDMTWYERSFRLAFEQFYGSIEDIAVLALLPSYLERSGSSLIYMIEYLIKNSNQEESNFFLYNHAELFQSLQSLKNKKTKTVLIGVTYALLDFIENYSIADFPELIIMETGGMKGKRKELIREELHDLLQKGFGVENIHSEYGMTELLSQGYSSGKGLFKTPNWMKILIRDTNDPLSLREGNVTGAINVIDLANYDSCSFIATQDLGKIYKDGQFEILGRFDNADIRGCNLLVQ